MVTHIKQELVLFFFSCAVEVTEEEEREIVVTVRLVVLCLPPHTLSDVLGIHWNPLVLQTRVLAVESEGHVMYSV